MKLALLSDIHGNYNLINCASVGMPVNHQTDTQFTQIEFKDNEWTVCLISLPYDFKMLLQDFEKSGLYEKCHWWAKSLSKCLQTGINYPRMVLTRALDISNKHDESLNENHWRQAANELGID